MMCPLGSGQVNGTWVAHAHFLRVEGMAAGREHIGLLAEAFSQLVRLRAIGANASTWSAAREQFQEACGAGEQNQGCKRTNSNTGCGQGREWSIAYDTVCQMRDEVLAWPEKSSDAAASAGAARKRRTIRREGLVEKIAHADSQLRMWSAVLEDARSELAAIDGEVDFETFPGDQEQQDPDPLALQSHKRKNLDHELRDQVDNPGMDCLQINEVVASSVLNFHYGATAGFLQKIGLLEMKESLLQDAQAQSFYQQRACARKTLGEVWFRYDFTSLMLYNLVFACDDLGTQLLHIFTITLLWQRWASYKEFLKEYEQKTSNPFCWASFDVGVFQSCLEAPLGNAYGRYRMLFWQAYAEQHKLLIYNQKGLAAHFLSRLFSSGVAGFQQLRGQGFCQSRVLQWLRDLGLPLESPRVEFVLLCLQRHLGIVYGVVSLDSLDFVGGGAVDPLNDLVSGAGTTKDKLRFFHDWFVARLSPDIVDVLGPWSLADTEHMLCEMRRSKEAYDLVRDLVSTEDVHIREGAAERQAARLRVLVTLRSNAPRFFPLASLELA